MRDEEHVKKIRFDVMPPDDADIFVPILSPRAGCRIIGEVISEHLVGVWTHYFQGRTEPHFIGDAGCPGCINHLSKRWKGYLAINHIATSRIGLAELTPWSVTNCPELREQPFRTVRGWLIDLSRPAGAKNGRVTCKIQPPPYKRELSPLPDPIDVPLALVRVWSGRRDGPSGVLLTGEWLEEPPF